ncbi:hypothetical protein SESBI_30946 [Sesbania bispinosa]|nr:hypothetical protein SESBI_30946 [Sesbania bispinosa]
MLAHNVEISSIDRSFLRLPLLRMLPLFDACHEEFNGSSDMVATIIARTLHKDQMLEWVSGYAPDSTFQRNSERNSYLQICDCRQREKKGENNTAGRNLCNIGEDEETLEFLITLPLEKREEQNVLA